MRLLFACELYHPSVGGVQEVMRQVSERLVEKGHEVTVATRYLSQRWERVLNGVRIKEFRVSGNIASGITGEVDAYRDYVIGGEYDLFMVKAAQQWTFDALVPVFERISKPKIFVPCGFSGLYEPAYADYYRCMPDWLSAFDQLVFYASDYRDINLARERGLSRFTIIPNGASEREFQTAPDPEFRRRHGIPEDGFVVLTVGNLNGQKGHHELAEAFALARFPVTAVLILNGNRLPQAAVQTLRGLVSAALRRAGLGWLLKALGARPPLVALVARINRAAPSKRTFIVDLPRAELVQAYLNSDLFVFASNVEYSPLVLFEAAAASLPFLSVPVGNAEEIARWTGAGEICPAPRDAKGYTRVEPRVLADRMQALASNPEKLKRMSEMGRANWLERFTWATIADQYQALFERVVAEKSRDAGANRRPVATDRSEAPA